MSRLPSFEAQLRALGVGPLSPADLRRLLEAALRDAPLDLFEAESWRRTDDASPDDFDTLTSTRTEPA